MLKQFLNTPYMKIKGFVRYVNDTEKAPYIGSIVRISNDYTPYILKNIDKYGVVTLVDCENRELIIEKPTLYKLKGYVVTEEKGYEAGNIVLDSHGETHILESCYNDNKFFHCTDGFKGTNKTWSKGERSMNHVMKIICELPNDILFSQYEKVEVNMINVKNNIEKLIEAE